MHVRLFFPLPPPLPSSAKKRGKTREKGELGASRKATENFVVEEEETDMRRGGEEKRRIAHITLFSRSFENEEDVCSN